MPPAGKGSGSVAGMMVELDPQTGSAGTMVMVRARPSSSEPLAQVFGEVLGYGFTQYLTLQGDVWTAQVMVPYEASPGDYTLEVRGVDAQGRPHASAQVTFRVTG